MTTTKEKLKALVDAAMGAELASVLRDLRFIEEIAGMRTRTSQSASFLLPKCQCGICTGAVSDPALTAADVAAKIRDQLSSKVLVTLREDGPCATCDDAGIVATTDSDYRTKRCPDCNED